MTGVTAAPGVVACVVTYNPGPELAHHLAILRPQVDALVVVDNGSANAQAVAMQAHANHCRFICNTRNLGIAAALNQAVLEAQALGARWLAMFDQDSSAGTDLIPRLLQFGQAHPLASQVGVLAASHRDRATRTDYHHPWDILEETPAARLLRSAITSGSLVRMNLFNEVGLFEALVHGYCAGVLLGSRP